ncbi:GNAT family N-acetyltransferase [Streptomyces sp. DSM 44915]|uniref:GNAT family N-acetyltransferase n=1 Tax=Streptomyces chisholmiae TaxID=3075540 RepID=A0ABU2JSV0_9ACTN|nr:GNAT family N-acetyltransferase [Streptomyces sp. DSM 44915]MDT0268068.1 GNAT family N-acetyltransferase [Streptomyces sp. DSM 44915]
MGYQVRRAGSADWARLRELRLTALRDPAAPMAFLERYEDAARLDQAAWEKRASDPERAILIGESDNGEWAGMVGVRLDEFRAEVIGVFIAADHRGTGLAGQLMRAAIDAAGPREVWLRVHQDNARAARFYTGLGFRATGDSAPDPRNATQLAYEYVYQPS